MFLGAALLDVPPVAEAGVGTAAAREQVAEPTGITSIQPVFPGVAEQAVHAESVVQEVIPGAAVLAIIPETAEQKVAAVPAPDDVVPAPPADFLGARSPDKRFGPRPAKDETRPIQRKPAVPAAVQGVREQAPQRARPKPNASSPGEAGGVPGSLSTFLGGISPESSPFPWRRGHSAATKKPAVTDLPPHVTACRGRRPYRAPSRGRLLILQHLRHKQRLSERSERKAVRNRFLSPSAGADAYHAGWWKRASKTR